MVTYVLPSARDGPEVSRPTGLEPVREPENFSRAKGVGAGVLEYRINFRPGYRVYFGKDGDTLVILLGGGTKKRQHRDIATAQDRWKDYKLRKSQEK